MSPGAFQYIVDACCSISSSRHLGQLSLQVLIILPVDHGDHSNLCYHRRRCFPPFDVHERLSVHPASSSVSPRYHIPVSHLSTFGATSSTSGAVESRRRSASALYISLNVFCVTFRVTSFDEAGERAGTLSIINMAPLFFGLHLSFLADLLGLSLSNYRRIHRSAGIMSFALMALHVFAAVHHDPAYSLHVFRNLYLLIVSHVVTSIGMSLTDWQGISSLSFLMILSLRFIRKLSYEFFLRTHQALAFLVGYVLWRHLISKSFVNRVCLYVSAGIFGFTAVVQLFATLYRNSVFQGRLPRAVITKAGGGFQISLTVHGKLKVDAGQYINLWIPSVSFWSFLQSHLFVVASCEEGEHTTLGLLVDPQKGFTSKLQRLARYESGSNRSDFRLALFTGLHGVSAPLGEFERVLMVASGFGIVAQLPYLRQLIRGYNDFTTRTRRIRLVWQLENIGKCAGRHW